MTFKHSLFASALLACASLVNAPEASAQEAYIGEIRILPYTFCPRGTAAADGQLLPISQYSALFSLYGTNFGGDGRTTFGLPDLRGRAPIHLGQGPGLSNYRIGQKGGQETVTLTTPEMPTHSHRAGVQIADEVADANSPKGNYVGTTVTESYVSSETVPSGKYMHADTIVMQNSGSSEPHQNMQPYIALQYCVVLEGIYPSRN